MNVYVLHLDNHDCNITIRLYGTTCISCTTIIRYIIHTCNSIRLSYTSWIKFTSRCILLTLIFVSVSLSKFYVSETVSFCLCLCQMEQDRLSHKWNLMRKNKNTKGKAEKTWRWSFNKCQYLKGYTCIHSYSLVCFNWVCVL